MDASYSTSSPPRRSQAAANGYVNVIPIELPNPQLLCLVRYIEKVTDTLES